MSIEPAPGANTAAAPLTRAQRTYLWGLIFTSGMSVMALEMTASRLVSPHFGTSISVWANVIGIIMAALSLGYWIGGRWAERRPELKVLLRIVAAGALLASGIPLLIQPAADHVIALLDGRSGATQVIAGSFTTLLLLFGAPVVLLGMTTPFAIRLLTLGRSEVGETTGGVFALSTIGSLLGTFLPAFALVPTIGTRATILLFTVLLLAVVALGFWGLKGGLLAAVLFALVPVAARAPIRPSPHQVAELESAYQYVEVTEDRGARMLRFDLGTTIQSMQRMNGLLTGGYWDLALPLADVTRAERPRVLILGFAAGSVGRGILESHTGKAVDVVGVEIDPAVLDLGRRYFELGKYEDRIQVHVADARMFLARSTEQYDVILLDCYANQRYIPFHLTTDEFFHMARQHLRPGGFLVANVNAPTRQSVLLQSFLKTMRRAFPYVDAVEVPGQWTRELVASAEPLDWDGAVERAPAVLRPVIAFERSHRVFLEDGLGQVLTDDRAPVELLTDAQVYAASRRN